MSQSEPLDVETTVSNIHDWILAIDVYSDEGIRDWIPKSNRFEFLTTVQDGCFWRDEKDVRAKISSYGGYLQIREYPI